jgi:membrane-associated HD superfamily phosphohydrolase
MCNYHNNAKLTKTQRTFIQNCSNPNFSKMAIEFRVSRQTIAKWYKWKFNNDKSSKPHNICYALTEEQKMFVKNIHSKMKYTIEELHNFISKNGINASKSTIYRCIKENIKADKKKTTSNIFKKYEPGFIHIDARINKTKKIPIRCY